MQEFNDFLFGETINEKLRREERQQYQQKQQYRQQQKQQQQQQQKRRQKQPVDEENNDTTNNGKNSRKNNSKNKNNEIGSEMKVNSVHEAAWSSFVSLSQLHPHPHLLFSDVPFLPPGFSFPAIFGLSSSSPRESKRARIRLAMLRWHPDKFEQAFGGRVREDEREAVREGVKRMSQRINELKKL